MWSQKYFYFAFESHNIKRDITILRKQKRYLSDFILIIRHFGQLEKYPETESLHLLLQLDLLNYLNTLRRFARGASLTWAYTQSREGSSKDSININNVSIGFVWPIAPFIACHSLVNSIIKKVIFCHFMLCIKLITTAHLS
jgi:hypothetical protein